MNKDLMLRLVAAVGFIVGASFIISMLIVLRISVGQSIPNETVQILGKTVIEVATALLGFLGIIHVFILRSFQSYRDRKNEQSLEVNLKIDRLQSKKQNESKSKHDSFDSEIARLEKLDSFLMRHVAYADNNIRAIVWAGGLAMAMFLASIMWGITEMGYSVSQSTTSNEYVEFLGVHYLEPLPMLFFLFAGIIGILIEFVLIYPSEPEEMKQKRKK